MKHRKRSLLTLLFTSLVLSVGPWLPSEVRPARAQVCGSERGCYASFPNTCIPAPTSIPTVNVHSAGDWYVNDLKGYCGAKRFLVLFVRPCGPPKAVRLCTNAEKGTL
jgi:hypothetical protein